jgi:hypothetical protein
MARIKTHFLRDHLGGDLIPGNLYGIAPATGSPTAAKLHRCTCVIRDYAFFAEGLGHRATRKISNLIACGLVFYACDETGRMIAAPTERTPDHAERIRAAIHAAATEAARIRARQAVLIERVIETLGVAPTPDFLDALAAFVRDDSSHVTPADLIALANGGTDAETS